MDGFINLNKPTGWTSHDCVAKVRKLLHIKRLGHGGTLDPAATGVLPLAVGRATRLLQFLPEGKSYQATIRLGVTTTTDDLEGEVLGTASAAGLSLEKVSGALDQFIGVQEQIPPRFSAIQVQGQRLYDLARAGKAVDVPIRTVMVDRIALLEWRPGEWAELDVAIACGPGTYIRAIARDLGEVLGVGGTLATLVRTASGGFRLDNSLTLTELEARLQDGSFQPISPPQALAHLPGVTLVGETAKRWCQGQQVPCSLADSLADGLTGSLVTDLCSGVEEDGKRAIAQQPLRVCDGKNGTFLGIGQLRDRDGDWLLVPQVVLSG